MTQSYLTLAEVFARPESVTYSLAAGEWSRAGEVTLRPMQADDVDAGGYFLEGLSAQTRHFSVFPSYDRAMAQKLCDAINRYDKLRLVVKIQEAGKVGDDAAAKVIGLMEFSFDIPEGDLQRYAHYGVALDPHYDCRFGPTLADDFQNQGLGSAIFPYVVDVARKFGKRRIVLWGGVLADNRRAIHFYEKHGFVPVGSFIAADGLRDNDMILSIDSEP